MKTNNESYGELKGAGEMRIVRDLPGPIERVWAYLTDPEKRARWFAGGAMELRAGGKAELKFRHANLAGPGEVPPAAYKEVHDPGVSFPVTISRCEPPRVLAYSWPEDDGRESEVTFELTAEGDRVRLVLTHRRIGSREQAANFGSGWHLHLEMLRARLEEATPPVFCAEQVRLEEAYRRRFGVGAAGVSDKL